MRSKECRRQVASTPTQFLEIGSFSAMNKRTAEPKENATAPLFLVRQDDATLTLVE